MSIGFALFCLLSVSLAEEPVQLSELNIELPQEISGIKYHDRKSYDSKEAGYSVNNASRMCSISLFVYDNGIEEIPEGPKGTLVASEMEEAISGVKAAEKEGFLKNVKFQEGKLDLPEGIESRFAAKAMTFDVKGGSCKSYLLITGRSNHFFKIRLTQYVVDGKTNDAEVADFLAAVAKLLE